MRVPELAELIHLAKERSRAMTRDELEDQVRNFAVGNIGLEHPTVTRAVVDRAVASRGVRSY